MSRSSQERNSPIREQSYHQIEYKILISQIEYKILISWNQTSNLAIKLNVNWNIKSSRVLNIYETYIFRNNALFLSPKHQDEDGMYTFPCLKAYATHCTI